MGESTNALQYATIGEIIKRYREQANLNITQLANLSGIRKGVISRIESGGIQRPRFRIIKALVRVMDTPYQKIIEHYVEVEQRLEVLLDLLLEAIQFSDDSIISKVAFKFLQSPRDNTYNLIEQLYSTAGNIENAKARLVIYDCLIKYSREHGAMQHLAKSLFQKYMIESGDFSKLEQTYKLGSYALHYANFLTQEERTLIYHILGVHAYNLRNYHDAIELCKKAADGAGDNGIKARAISVICSSYLRLDMVAEAQPYFDTYKRFASYPFVEENAKVFTAIFEGRKGHIDIAIKQLQECLCSSTSKDSTLIVVNRLFELYLENNDLESIKHLFQHEVKAKELTVRTPSQFSEVALFHKLKGIYSLKVNEFDNAIDYYISSALLYGQVSDYINAFQCLRLVTEAYLDEDKVIEKSVLNKLKKMYNMLERQIRGEVIL